jgi:fatty-acyl-CoA synthase
MKRHDAKAVIHDDEFVPIVDEAAEGRLRVVGWADEKVGDGATTIDALVRRFQGKRKRPAPPRWSSRLIILTSGTTGTPKGASRGGLQGAGVLHLFEALPARANSVTVIACPIFHSWGLANAGIAVALGSPIVLRRKFDPEKTLELVAKNRAPALAVVPVMMQRMVDLPEEVRNRYDVSCLRMVGASGSALAGDLATRFMDAFGDVVYNLYGSTEVGYVSVAGPRDLRDAPGTAGRPVRGNHVELLDDDDQPVPQGEIGRIFVGNSIQFEGYTGGGTKETVAGLMSTGDVGHVDEAGRLFVDGRDDDMIVSGGENVFPREIEELLVEHAEIEDAAVVGVPDPDFGARLRAYIVRRNGAALDEEAVKSYVKENLARYKVPREIRFIDEMPRNPAGKVVKRELPGMEEE